MYVSYDSYQYRDCYKRRGNRRTRKAVAGEKAFRFVKLVGCLSSLLLIGILLWKQVESHAFYDAEAHLAANMDVAIASENMSEIFLATEKDAEEEIAIVEKERIAPLIVLDPGHGGEDEGCSRKEVLEKDMNLEIARRTEAMLVEMGYEVVLTREGDELRSLEERVGCANEKNADIFVSIHQNACEEEESSICGVETWYYEKWDEEGSKRLAQLFQQEIVESTQAVDRGIVSNDSLYVIRETNMPACLVETGFLSNREERTLLSSAEYQDKIAEALARAIDLYFHPKTMYLTFDDGPSPENTNAILDILKEKHVKATFFVVGENVLRYPDVARRIVEEGHTIGIHCNHHEYGEIYQSVDSYVADFEEAYNAVYEVTGVEAKLFRFPGGSINSYNRDVYQDIIEEMTDRGFVYFDWNASLEDAVTKSEPGALIANARQSTLGRKKVVMLAHDIVSNTRICLEDLLEQFPEYKMEPLTEEVTPIQF